MKFQAFSFAFSIGVTISLMFSDISLRHSCQWFLGNGIFKIFSGLPLAATLMGKSLWKLNLDINKVSHHLTILKFIPFSRHWTKTQSLILQMKDCVCRHFTITLHNRMFGSVFHVNEGHRLLPNWCDRPIVCSLTWLFFFFFAVRLCSGGSCTLLFRNEALPCLTSVDSTPSF